MLYRAQWPLDACLRRHDVHYMVPFPMPDGALMLLWRIKSFRRQAAEKHGIHKTNHRNASLKWDSNGAQVGRWSCARLSQIDNQRDPVFDVKLFEYVR